MTDDVTFTEYPNLIKPAGATDRAEQRSSRLLRAGARAAARPSCYDVHHAIAHGNTAILRLTWTGTVARGRTDRSARASG